MSHPYDDDAFSEGFDAYHEGIDEDENPHYGIQYAAWQDGWLTAEHEMMGERKRSAKNA